MAKIQPLSLDFTGGVTRNQMETIVNKINEIIASQNKQTTLEINLNQEYNDPERIFDIQEAVRLSRNIMRAYGLRLRFLAATHRYEEYSYIGTSLDENDWTNLDNWCTGIDIVDGGEF